MSDDQWLLNELREKIELYYSDLVSYIEWLSENRYYWKKGHMPAGKTAEDVAQVIIFKTLNGERKSFDPSKGTLRKWLRMQALSIVDALAKSATHRQEDELPEEDVFSEDDNSSPEDQLIAQELENERQAMISKEVNMLFQITDPTLKEIVEAIVNGCEPKTRFLAEALGTDAKDINKRLKRLRRLAKKGETANE